MLFLLCQVTQVMGWWSGEDLARWHRLTILQLGSSCQYCKAFNYATLSNRSSHANVGERLKFTRVQFSICTNVHIVMNYDIRSACWSSKSRVVLNHGVLSNCNFRKIASHGDSVPDWCSLVQFDVANKHCIRCNPVSFKTIWDLVTVRKLSKWWNDFVFMSHEALHWQSLFIDWLSNLA